MEDEGRSKREEDKRAAKKPICKPRRQRDTVLADSVPCQTVPKMRIEKEEMAMRAPLAQQAAAPAAAKVGSSSERKKVAANERAAASGDEPERSPSKRVRLDTWKEGPFRLNTPLSLMAARKMVMADDRLAASPFVDIIVDIAHHNLQCAALNTAVLEKYKLEEGKTKLALEEKKKEHAATKEELATSIEFRDRLGVQLDEAMVREQKLRKKILQLKRRFREQKAQKGCKVAEELS